MPDIEMLKGEGRINLKNIGVVDKGGIFDKNRDASLFIWEKIKTRTNVCFLHGHSIYNVLY